MDLIVMSFLASCNNIQKITDVANDLIGYIQIIVPIVLVLWGSLDLIKAAMSGEAKQMEEGKQTFIKRLMYGVAVFLVSFIVGLAVGIGENNDDDCLETGESCNYERNAADGTKITTVVMQSDKAGCPDIVCRYDADEDYEGETSNDKVCPNDND